MIDYEGNRHIYGEPAADRVSGFMSALTTLHEEYLPEDGIFQWSRYKSQYARDESTWYDIQDIENENVVSASSTSTNNKRKSIENERNSSRKDLDKLPEGKNNKKVKTSKNQEISASSENSTTAPMSDSAKKVLNENGMDLVYNNKNDTLKSSESNSKGSQQSKKFRSSSKKKASQMETSTSSNPPSSKSQSIPSKSSRSSKQIPSTAKNSNDVSSSNEYPSTNTSVRSSRRRSIPGNEEKKISREDNKISEPSTTLPESNLNDVSAVLQHCSICNDIETNPCTQCGCRVCGGKEDEDKTLGCEKCLGWFHMWCLPKPLTKIPKGEW